MWLGRKRLGKCRSHLTDPSPRWQMAMFRGCSGDFLGIRKQPSFPESFWMVKGAVVAGWRGFFVCGAEEEVALVTQRACGRSLCWASVCPHACLFVALKEAGAGPAAAWAELLLRGHSSCLWLQTHHFVPHSSRQSTWGIGPACPE